MSKQDNRILLHILKHNPCDGEVYITWEGETFCGQIQDIEVNRGVNILTTFKIKGIVKQ
jgi:hypothetical protein